MLGRIGGEVRSGREEGSQEALPVAGDGDGRFKDEYNNDINTREKRG